jgi:hypothetical protein
VEEGMNRNNYSGYKATSHVDLLQVTSDFHYRSCQVPVEFQDLIDQIIYAHMNSLALALGSLELCYLRTKQHKEQP